MVADLASLDDALDGIGAVVLDQWGVLHDGAAPCPGALETLQRLGRRRLPLAVLSNSGKRADVNAARMAAMGLPAERFDCVMTSGEALWRDFADGRLPAAKLHPITRAPGDEEVWGEGLDVSFAPIEDAEAVLLMGLPDSAELGAHGNALDTALARGLPVYCSNPDRASPREGGRLAVSPGALAHAHAAAGGGVSFYGKPHVAVFRAVERALGLPSERLVMVGDSLEHDIAGARAAGWRSVFVRGGLHAAAFRNGPMRKVLDRLAREANAPLPDATLERLA